MIELTAGEADELLEFLGGEGSCALAHDAVFELYDALDARPAGTGYRWEIAPEEAAELLEPVGDCTDTLFSGCPELLYGRLLDVCGGA